MGLKGDQQEWITWSCCFWLPTYQTASGKGLSRCVGRSPWAVGSPVEHVAHREEGTFFLQLFHGQQRTMHLSLTQPLLETQGAAFELNPLKSFLA